MQGLPESSNWSQFRKWPKQCAKFYDVAAPYIDTPYTIWRTKSIADKSPYCYVTTIVANDESASSCRHSWSPSRQHGNESIHAANDAVGPSIESTNGTNDDASACRELGLSLSRGCSSTGSSGIATAITPKWWWPGKRDNQDAP